MDYAPIRTMRVHTGPFAWDDAEFHAHAARLDKQHAQQYNPRDPRTWPLVRSVKLENGKDYRRSKTLLPFVAYHAILMEDLAKQKPMQRFGKTLERGPLIHGLSSDYHRLFQRFPFNFDRMGQLRKTESVEA